MSPSLILIRGLPGSGKSTLSLRLTRADLAIEADQFYFDTRDGVYRFDLEKITEAHQWCQRRTRDALRHVGELGLPLPVVVANTFTRRWEVEPYLQIARDTDAALTIISLFDAGLDPMGLSARCLHGVPPETILKMRERWEHDLGHWSVGLGGVSP